MAPLLHRAAIISWFKKMSVLSQESDVTIAHVSHLQSLPHAHNGEQTAGIGMVWRNCVTVTLSIYALVLINVSFSVEQSIGCVCVSCVRTTTLERNDLWFYILSVLCRPDLKIKVMGQSSKAPDEKCLFLIEKWKWNWEKTRHRRTVAEKQIWILNYK